jgi:hypothetical protein
MVVGMFLAATLFLWSYPWFPHTARGVQCPTATVQTVTEVSLVRNCCGKLVAKTIQRKPREGEPGFKQCRCAEKKAADAQQKSEASESSRPALAIAILNPLFQFQAVSILPAAIQAHTYLFSSSFSPAFAPPTPPPQLI